MRKSFLDEKYRPTGESVLKESKISIVCGLFSIVLFVLLVWLSFRSGGNAGKYLGFVGWLLMISACVGEYYAVVGFGQPGGKINAKICGALLNGIMIIILMLIFIRGIL